MERPIKQNYMGVWRVMCLCFIPAVFAMIAVGVVLYTHGHTDPIELLKSAGGFGLMFLALLAVVALAMMQPTVKWFITDTGLKRVIRGDVLEIPWTQIYHMSDTGYHFFIRWRDPQEPGASAEDLEHKGILHLSKADADELIALWKRNTSHELQVGGTAHFKARNRKTSKDLRAMGWVMTVIGAALIGWGGLTIARQYPSTKWPSVEGKILSQFYRTVSSHKSVSGEVAMSYEYFVAGITYRSGQYSLARENYRDSVATATAFAQSHQRGTVVTVYYNPNHPEQAVLQTGPEWHDCYGFMTFGGFLAFIAFMMRAVDNIDKRRAKLRIH
jgi:hypothetical protein